MSRRSPGFLGPRTLAVITILAITGTLFACGRYGSPVRVAPTEISAEGPQAKAVAADESSDHEAERDRTE